MKFCSLSSGSRGNCQYLETKYMKVLIDAGLSARKIEHFLAHIGVHPSQIDYIFVTHEHMDHIKGVGPLSRRYNIPIVASFGTWMAIEKIVGKIPDENRCVFSPGEECTLGDLDFMPFHIYHDAADPVGFAFYHEKKKAIILTDSGIVTPQMKKIICKADLYLIEANHDPLMLEKGPYPRQLKQRIASDYGHLSNEISGQVLSEVLKGEREVILLGHLSEENNMPKVALNTVARYLIKRGLDIRKDLRMGCARVERPSPLIALE